MTHHKKNRLGLGIIVGAIAGVVAGLLTAPKSGKETRKHLKNKADAAHKDMEVGMQEGRKKAEEISKEAKHIAEDMKDRAEHARDAAKDAIHHETKHQMSRKDSVSDAKTKLEKLKDR